MGHDSWNLSELYRGREEPLVSMEADVRSGYGKKPRQENVGFFVFLGQTFRVPWNFSVRKGALSKSLVETIMVA